MVYLFCLCLLLAVILIIILSLPHRDIHFRLPIRRKPVSSSGKPFLQAFCSGCPIAIISSTAVSPPIQDEQQTEYHSSEMGEMSDSVTGVPQSGKQLYDGITYHKKLGFNRYGKRKNKQAFIRKRHAESQQNSIDCTRGSDSVQRFK